MAKRTAIIDIGSNSIRMVIFEKSSRFAFHLIHEVKSRVRISENAYDNGGNLQDKALLRAFSTLKEFQQIIKEYKAYKTLVVATSALRDAPNQKEFIKKIKKELGLAIKTIDGDKEAYLGGLAAANLLYLDNGLTIDIGGGSTELALFKEKKIVKTLTLNLGTVRLKELYFDLGNVKGAKAHIRKELEKISDTFRCDNLIGIGGTLRALSKMIIDKDDISYKKLHGFSYKVSSHLPYFKKILKSESADLKGLGVKEERLDIIQPGVLILSLLIEKIEAKQIITSGVGVREGLFLADLLRSQQDKFPHNYNPSVTSILDRFTKSTIDLSLAKKLFELSSTPLKIQADYKTIFLTAVKLLHIGKELDFYEAHRHAYYQILNGLSYGFSHQETVLIATLVRFQRKTSISSSHISKYGEYLPDKSTLDNLSFLIRLIQTLYMDFNQKIELNLEKKNLEIKVSENYLLQSRLKELQKKAPLTLTLL